MTISQWLSEATTLLSQKHVSSARLDAELILSHTLRKPRTYLHAHGEETIDIRREDIATARLDLRLSRTPVAYIIGHKEFYGRRFMTTPAALIPRPESEAIIDSLKTIISDNLSLLPQRTHIVDVGTGTGCLGITAKLEWPELDVTLTDISQHALNLAEKNAKALSADVSLVKNDLLRGYALTFDIIIANLPYVNQRWEVSPDTVSEPDIALYASDDGLALIKELIDQTNTRLKKGGYLVLESDERQHQQIVSYCRNHHLKHLDTNGLVTVFQSV